MSQSTSLRPVFQASLSGDVLALRACLADRDAATPEGYTPLSLAISAGHSAAVRLLLREGVNVNAADSRGVTALMHAAMHGYSEMIDLLLLHGARPMQLQHDGQAAPGLAALFGRPAAIGAFLRADPALLDAADGRGRTLLHWAVASQHVPTLKYLLGRWGDGAAMPDSPRGVPRASVADAAGPTPPVPRASVADAAGDTPLHLCRGPPTLLLLLYHGAPQPPSLTARNAAGQSAAEAADAAGCAEVASILAAAAEAKAGVGEAEEPPPRASWLEGNAGSAAAAQLCSFLPGSAARKRPATVPRGAWCRTLSTGRLLSAGGGFGLLLLLCASPPAAALAFSAWVACARVVASPVGRRLLGVRAGAAAHERTSSRVRELAEAQAAERLPLLLLLCVCTLLTLHAALLLPFALSHAPAVGAATVAFEVLLALSYVRLLISDPGMLAGGDPADAAAYWAALERLPAGDGLPHEFCDRSELQRPPRAKFSPLSGGMVRVMDHDCVWVGTCIGEGNHRSFVLMLLSGEIALLCCMHTLSLYLHSRHRALRFLWAALAVPQSAAAAAVHARLLLLLTGLTAALLLMVTPLLLSQLALAAVNLTTVEFLRSARTGFARPPGASAHDHDHGSGRSFPLLWCGALCGCGPRDFAPHSRGMLRNLLAFALARRGGAGGAPRAAAPTVPMESSPLRSSETPAGQGS